MSYVVDEKPDLTGTPVPRFDLLDTGCLSMTVQFSRGCLLA